MSTLNKSKTNEEIERFESRCHWCRYRKLDSDDTGGILLFTCNHPDHEHLNEMPLRPWTEPGHKEPPYTKHITCMGVANEYEGKCLKFRPVILRAPLRLPLFALMIAADIVDRRDKKDA